MSTFDATLNLVVNVVESLDASETPGQTGQKVRHAGLSRKLAGLDAASTPPVAKQTVYAENLAAASKVIDLTACQKTGGSTQSLSGLKAVAIIFENQGAASMTLGPDTTNGFEPFGAGVSLTIQPGGELLFYYHATGAPIDATHKGLKITGTSGQGFKLQLLAG